MHIAAAGDRALLVTLAGATASRLRAAADALRGFDAAIVGHESIYVVGTDDAAAVRGAIARAGDDAPQTTQRHSIEVSFAPQHALDIDVLTAKAEAARDAVIARIASLTLTARYLGFRAGFAYLDGWPREWSLPRRPTSRNVVPGGSFAIGGAMAGFYPADLPGGWNVLGRTDQLPRILPGDEVRIVPVDRPLHIVPPAVAEPEGPAIADVLAPGQLTTVVSARDWRRAGSGDTPGGPFDETAAAIANAAAGNGPHAPLLECVLVGPRLRFHAPRRVAWCGPDLHVHSWVARDVDIGRLSSFRGWLAIEGGVSAFAKSIRSAAAAPPLSPHPAAAAGPPQARSDRLTIRAMRGPHDAPPLSEEWKVTPNLNRVGIRLEPLGATSADLPRELPSCGMQFGTLQWHPDGSLVAMGPDHPVTGGYLQPATVITSELWKLAQLAPGERVRLLTE